MAFFCFWLTIGCVTAVIFASFFEWTLHRYLMHRPFGKFDYPFRTHALVHHQTFKADHTYHLIHEKDKHTIPMAWWNGPVLIAVGMLPFAALRMEHRPVGCPLRGPAWRRRLLRRLRIHALVHALAQETQHRTLRHLLPPQWPPPPPSPLYGQELQCVFPLADLCLGTLLLRSKVHFKQAQGPSVPNVQPRAPRRRLPKLAAAD